MKRNLGLLLLLGACLILTGCMDVQIRLVVHSDGSGVETWHVEIQPDAAALGLNAASFREEMPRIRRCEDRASKSRKGTRSLEGTQPIFEHAEASATAGSFSVSASANVAWGDSLNPGYGSSGRASVMEEYQVEAIGATGPGFLLLTPFASTTPDQGSGTTFATASVDSASGPVTGIESHLGSRATCSPCEFAVNLGTIYDFTLEASVDSEADLLNPDDSGMASAGLRFQFLEANGTTPVRAEVIPEPGTVSLVGCALLVGLVFGLRRRKHT